MTAQMLTSIAILALSAASILDMFIMRHLRKRIERLTDLVHDLDEELAWTRRSLNKVEVLVKALASKKDKK